MDILTFINSLTNEDLNRIRNSKSDAEARRLLREYQALQLQQTGVIKSLHNYELEFCEKCFQMTNHLNNKCQKCKGNVL